MLINISSAHLNCPSCCLARSFIAKSEHDFRWICLESGERLKLILVWDVLEVMLGKWPKPTKEKQIVTEILENYILWFLRVFCLFGVFFCIFKIYFPQECLSFFLKWLSILQWNCLLWVDFSWAKTRSLLAMFMWKKKSLPCEFSKLSFCCVYNKQTFLYLLHGEKVHCYVTCPSVLHSC